MDMEEKRKKLQEIYDTIKSLDIVKSINMPEFKRKKEFYISDDAMEDISLELLDFDYFKFRYVDKDCLRSESKLISIFEKHDRYFTVTKSYSVTLKQFNKLYPFYDFYEI